MQGRGKRWLGVRMLQLVDKVAGEGVRALAPSCESTEPMRTAIHAVLASSGATRIAVLPGMQTNCRVLGSMHTRGCWPPARLLCPQVLPTWTADTALHSRFAICFSAGLQHSIAQGW